MTREFDDLIESGNLSPEERQRLEAVHEMLVAAGPPPELPAALREPPAPAAAPVVALSSRRPRRGMVGALIAAAIAIAVFACGYVIGDRAGDGPVVRTLGLEGIAQPGLGTSTLESARASVSLRDGEGGNWPMELTVTDLPQPTAERAYYELFVWRDGEPGFPCVGFKMRADSTTVHFTVPYELKDDTELVVTYIEPGKVSWPGTVVMRTV